MVEECRLHSGKLCAPFCAGVLECAEDMEEVPIHYCTPPPPPPPLSHIPPACPLIHPPFCPPTHPSIRLLKPPSHNLSFTHSSAHPSTHPHAHLPIHLSIYPPIHPSTCPPFHQSTSPVCLPACLPACRSSVVGRAWRCHGGAAASHGGVSVEAVHLHGQGQASGHEGEGG